ncbi:MAG: hypothetical protein A7315_00425 [Candidatus Altiarchaeales archaeon WOR_SM1_79]|nr:MAG: hypothetical protein A7315_00425 [Candidatus Altiarchaeales archaeon WOR_SM1_79]
MADELNVIWLQGQGCTGCTVSLTGGTHPSIVDVLTGFMPQIEGINLVYHPTLMLPWGEEAARILKDAEEGKYDPIVLVVEGAVPDEDKASKTGGYYCGIGDLEGKMLTLNDVLSKLAERAGVVVAVGTCASFGGIPHGKPNPTGAKSVLEFLGRDYKSALGLPVINVSGCPPHGEYMIEALGHLVLTARGALPVPELDEHNRPVFLYGEKAHETCPRAGHYAEGDYSREFGDAGCMGMLGCKGPISHCDVPRRGFVEGVGGCPTVGGLCIGCTEPEFPDAPFGPFLRKAPGIVYARETFGDIKGKISALIGRLVPRSI